MNTRVTQLVIVQALLMVVVCAAGCSQLRHWKSNGYKVGPNYFRPSAEVNPDWRANEPGEEAAFVTSVTSSSSANHINTRWWESFNDPVLTELIEEASQNNQDVKTALHRVLKARFQRRATAGTLFPQSQTASGAFNRNQSSLDSGVAVASIDRITDTWSTGFDLSWELDFWGRIRRQIIAADADYDAAVENLDDVLVTLIGDVAETYLELRSIDERLTFAKKNIEIQKSTLEINETKLELGDIAKIDVVQAKSNLLQTEATIPPLLQIRRQAENRLSVLLGIPPADIISVIGEGQIPIAPETIVVGIPAELLLRRPDVRAAERIVASQSEQIGIATADLYPTFSITGSLSLSADEFSDLFRSASSGGSFIPSFSWNILNYGRITNNVRVQEQGFLEEVSNYQSAVLVAQQEVEDAMAQFLYSRREYKILKEAVDAAAEAVDLGEIQWKEGDIEFNQIFTLQSTLVSLQDQLVVVELEIAQGLVNVYRGLGGGWEVRQDRCIPAVEFAATSECFEGKQHPSVCRKSVGCNCSACSLAQQSQPQIEYESQPPLESDFNVPSETPAKTHGLISPVTPALTARITTDEITR